MVRVGDAHIRRRVGRNVRDDILVNGSVIRVGLQRHVDVRIKLFEFRDGLLINVDLRDVRIIFRPEGDRVFLFCVKFHRHPERNPLLAAVAARKRAAEEHQDKQERGSFGKSFHPLVPPLDTPSMILFRKHRNKMMSGTEMTTTAAIMAGMLSRPKPFWRIS